MKQIDAVSMKLAFDLTWACCLRVVVIDGSQTWLAYYALLDAAAVLVKIMLFWSKKYRNMTFIILKAIKYKSL